MSSEIESFAQGHTGDLHPWYQEPFKALRRIFKHSQRLKARGSRASLGSIIGKDESNKLKLYVGRFLLAFRWISLGVAAGHIVYQLGITHLSMPHLLLVAAIGWTIYTALPSWRVENRKRLYFNLSADFIVCAALAASTGGIRSPFILYSLNPIFMSAALLSGRIGWALALWTVAVVAVSSFLLPYGGAISFSEMSYFGIYLVASALACILPVVVKSTILSATSSERRRLSHELHDGPAQTLTGLCLQIQSLRKDLAGKGLVISQLQEIEKTAKDVCLDTREYLNLLRTVSGSGDFPKVLKENCEVLARQGGISMQVDCPSVVRQVSPEVQLQLVHICNEGLNNILKHSQASNVIVKVVQANEQLIVYIKDDGCGFDLDESARHPYAMHHGLSVMKERAESVGGKVDIASSPRQGTELRITVPVLNTGDTQWLLAQQSK